MEKHIIDYTEKLKTALSNLNTNEIKVFAEILQNALDNKKMIFFMGNGGSAALASHFVCDFNKGVSFDKDKKFKMLCLNDNKEILMAYSNDISYEDIFVKQLENYFETGDVVVGISGSGNSRNVLKAVEFANANGGVTVGITGYDGGHLKKIAQHSVNANVDDMQLSEDIHLSICHMLMQHFNKKPAC